MLFQVSMWVSSRECVLSLSVVCGSLRSFGLEPARLLWAWDFPGKTTGKYAPTWDELGPCSDVCSISSLVVPDSTFSKISSFLNCKTRNEPHLLIPDLVWYAFLSQYLYPDSNMFYSFVRIGWIKLLLVMWIYCHLAIWPQALSSKE